jgi:cytochrome c553
MAHALIEVNTVVMSSALQSARRIGMHGLLSVVSFIFVAPAPVIASPARVEQMVQRALQLDRHPEQGARQYEKYCSSCHGPDALGNSVRVIPSLAGQRRAYLIKQLADFTELERAGDDMHKVVARTPLDEPQTWVDIAAYLNSLPPAVLQETGEGVGVEFGEAIFQEQCASCHEEDARGDDDGFVPSLRNQHYSYLLRQMRGLGSTHQRNVEPDLSRFLESFESDELTAVADYLSRMQSPVRDRTRLDDDGTAGN